MTTFYNVIKNFKKILMQIHQEINFFRNKNEYFLLSSCDKIQKTKSRGQRLSKQITSFKIAQIILFTLIVLICIWLGIYLTVSNRQEDSAPTGSDPKIQIVNSTY